MKAQTLVKNKTFENITPLVKPVVCMDEDFVALSRAISMGNAIIIYDVSIKTPTLAYMIYFIDQDSTFQFMRDGATNEWPCKTQIAAEGRVILEIL